MVTTADQLTGSEIVPQDLIDRPFVLREQGSATRQAVEEGLAACGIRPRIAMELGSNTAVPGAVAMGAGVGVMPSRMIYQPKIKRIRVRGLAFSRPFVLLTERDRVLSPAAEAFVAICRRKEISDQ